MASAAPAYKYYSEPARKTKSSRRSSNIDVHAIPGNKAYRNQHEDEVSPALKWTIIVSVLAITLLALSAFGRIALNNLAVEYNRASATVDTELTEARAVGNALEVSGSTLSASVYVQEKATSLGMGEPTNVTVITLPEDIVATDNHGNLSLGLSALKTKGLS